jgi:hypothetical protein
MQPAEISIRQYRDCLECEVVVVVRGQEMIIGCPNYEQAVRWARMECRSYKAPSNFPESRPPM